MANYIVSKNFVQKEVRNMVPHCERMFHVEQTVSTPGGERWLRHFEMFHVEQCDAANANVG